VLVVISGNCVALCVALANGSTEFGIPADLLNPKGFNKIFTINTFAG
jgi:hypothetical protein